MTTENKPKRFIPKDNTPKDRNPVSKTTADGSTIKPAKSTPDTGVPKFKAVNIGNGNKDSTLTESPPFGKRKNSKFVVVKNPPSDVKVEDHSTDLALPKFKAVGHEHGQDSNNSQPVKSHHQRQNQIIAKSTSPNSKNQSKAEDKKTPSNISTGKSINNLKKVDKVSPKNGKVVFLLCTFLGLFGGHRFYTGHVKQGFLYLFTAGLFLIGWIVDLVKIASNNYYDSKHRLIRF